MVDKFIFLPILVILGLQKILIGYGVVFHYPHQVNIKLLVLVIKELDIYTFLPILVILGLQELLIALGNGVVFRYPHQVNIKVLLLVVDKFIFLLLV